MPPEKPPRSEAAPGLHHAGETIRQESASQEPEHQRRGGQASARTTSEPTATQTGPRAASLSNLEPAGTSTTSPATPTSTERTLLHKSFATEERPRLPQQLVEACLEQAFVAPAFGLMERALEGEALSQSRALMRSLRLTASELGENLVRYANWGHETAPSASMSLSRVSTLQPSRGAELRIYTENHLDLRHASLDSLFETLERIEQFGPELAFRKRMMEAGTEALDAPTRLGLLRIAFEGKAVIRAEVNAHGPLRICATLPLEAFPFR